MSRAEIDMQRSLLNQDRSTSSSISRKWPRSVGLVFIFSGISLTFASLFQSPDQYFDLLNPDRPAHQENLKIAKGCEPPHDIYPFCNTTLTIEQRIDDLVSRLTLEEKPYILVARESPMGNISRLGIPEYDFGANCMHGVQSRCAPDADGRVGYGACATSFPDPNALGSTFNRTIWEQMGRVIGLEMRALWRAGVGEAHSSNLPHLGLDCWSPNVGLNRDPRWGRNMETAGEDPFLNGEYGRLYSQGLQNPPSEYSSDSLMVVATLKHFVANTVEGPWGRDGNITRDTINVNITPYDLSSSYFPAFRTSVIDGGALGIMCSYNAVNGFPSCANHWMLTDKLRHDWKFDGYVTSDSGAIVDLVESHHYSANKTVAVADAIHAGCDVQSAPWPHGPWATGGWFISEIPEAVKLGLLTETDVDAAVRNVLRMRFRLGLFNPIKSDPLWNVPISMVHSPEHVAAAIDATEQGLVLLKNENATLPMPTSSGEHIAVIGPLTDGKLVQKAILGNYIGQICPGEQGLSCVKTPCVSINELRTNGKTSCVAGMTGIQKSDPKKLEQAINAAELADRVVIMLGIDSSIEREGHDRSDLRLPHAQLQLAEAVFALQKPTTVVLINGGSLELDWLLTRPVAIVEAWLPGFYGGPAIARALFGVTNRWGKSTVTHYDSSFSDDFDMLDFNMGKAPGRSYRYYTKIPNYPFGYGLSYTKFNLSWNEMDRSKSGAVSTIKLNNSNKKDNYWRKNTVNGKSNKNKTENNKNDKNKNNKKKAREVVTLDITVKNTGEVAGDEVVMCFFYASDFLLHEKAMNKAQKLQRQLFDFERISLEAGNSTLISFQISASTFALHADNGDLVILPGSYEILCSNGQDEQTIRKSVRIEGSREVTERF